MVLPVSVTMAADKLRFGRGILDGVGTCHGSMTAGCMVCSSWQKYLLEIAVICDGRRPAWYLHYSGLLGTTLQWPAWYYTTVACLVLHYCGLLGTTLQWPAWYYTTVSCLVLHYSGLLGTTLLWPAWYYTTVACLVLHYCGLLWYYTTVACLVLHYSGKCQSAEVRWPF